MDLIEETYSEEQLISQLSRMFSAPKDIVSIGDDCAILPWTKEMSLLLSSDSFVENIHFKKEFQSSEDLAIKALNVNMSDISSMGGKAKYVLVNLSAPELNKKWIDGFLSGLKKTCDHSGLQIIGGDTTKSTNEIFVSITIIGEVENKYIKTRNAAKPGDLICASGPLGYAKLGLLQKQRNPYADTEFTDHYIRPEIDPIVGQWLGQQENVHAMMDLSDGLYLDLEKLCKASNVGAKIDCDEFLLMPDYIRTCEENGVRAINMAIAGGEDYQLLFTIAPENHHEFLKAYERAVSSSFNVIGEIKKEKKIEYQLNNTEFTPKLDLYFHF